MYPFVFSFRGHSFCNFFYFVPLYFFLNAPIPFRLRFVLSVDPRYGTSITWFLILFSLKKIYNRTPLSLCLSDFSLWVPSWSNFYYFVDVFYFIKTALSFFFLLLSVVIRCVISFIRLITLFLKNAALPLLCAFTLYFRYVISLTSYVYFSFKERNPPPFLSLLLRFSTFGWRQFSSRRLSLDVYI